MIVEERNYFRKKYIVISAIALVLIGSVVAFVLRNGSNSKIVYKEAVVEKGDIDVTILSTGIVQPENRLEIKPPIAGRVEEVLVDEGQNVKKGQTLVLMSSSERAALLDAARARGAEELKRWEGFYRPAPILAPIDGTIIARNVEPGQSFTTQDAVLIMSDRLTVKAQVDETDIAKIVLKEVAEVTLDAYPDDEISAHVDQIAYEATTVSNVTTYIVDVLPDQTPEFMRSGMTANVRFTVSSKQGVLLVPVNAVKKGGDAQFVLVPAETSMGTPVEKAIETGVTNGKEIEVVSGLQEGDIVLVQQLKREGADDNSSPFGPPKFKKNEKTGK